MFAGLRLLRPTNSLASFSSASRWLNTSQSLSAVARTSVDPALKAKALTNKKNEKVVMWKIYATFHRHNTLCSLVAVVEDLDFMKKNDHLTYNEKVLYYMQLPHQVKLHVSAGMLGFRKAHRAEYEAGYQVSSRLFKMIEEKKLFGPNDKVELVLRDFGKGREAFTSALQGKEGASIRPHIVRVTDNTRLKFGGSRSKKLRRL
ncbi:CIC11C00000003031 [Sungouiella intermedia]|uniref:Small ribosomal subunit protein uS11m n=1 Tax=Sungouiella intermedia TaxID=45354 RepID=A0A1L0BEP6_9ASCO|nr:CIC11C00000003031 [[Candida] intermedia]